MDRYPALDCLCDFLDKVFSKIGKNKMYVMDRPIPFDDFCAFPFTDLPNPVSEFMPDFLSGDAKTIFGTKNHTVIAKIFVCDNCFY
jgi:hypothetical protein